MTPKPPLVQIQLHDADGRIYSYSGFEDGPLSEWLLSVVPKLTDDFNRMSNNSTIRVWAP